MQSTTTTQRKAATPETRALFVAVAHLAAAFIAFSIGAALRHYLTGAIPDLSSTIGATLWGWPIGAPLYAVAAYLARPVQ